MIPSDSVQKPIISLPPRFQPFGRVLAVLVAMLAVGCLTLGYDGVVGAIIFWIEVTYHSKSDNHLLKTAAPMLAAGLVVGGLAAIGLLLHQKCFRALAVLLGLLPLALFMYLVCEILWSNSVMAA